MCMYLFLLKGCIAHYKFVRNNLYYKSNITNFHRMHSFIFEVATNKYSSDMSVTILSTIKQK